MHRFTATLILLTFAIAMSVAPCAAAWSVARRAGVACEGR